MTGIGAGHFAMKFINLRRPGSKPVFVVLPSENKKYTFYINNVKVVNQSINQLINQSINCSVDQLISCILYSKICKEKPNEFENAGQLEERDHNSATWRARGCSAYKVNISNHFL